MGVSAFNLLKVEGLCSKGELCDTEQTNITMENNNSRRKLTKAEMEVMNVLSFINSGLVLHRHPFSSGLIA